MSLTVLLLAPVKEESELGFTEPVIIVVWSPSKINSSTLSTTTRIGIFQFAGVNVTLVVAKEASVRSPLEKLISTFVAGIAVRTTEKLTELRGCSVKFPLIGPSIKSPISLSLVTTVTVWLAKPKKFESEEASISAVIDVVWSPSTKSSSTLFKIIVWVTFQVALVKVRVVVPIVFSLTSLLIRFIKTSFIGCLVKITVNEAVVVSLSVSVPITGFTI